MKRKEWVIDYCEFKFKVIQTSRLSTMDKKIQAFISKVKFEYDDDFIDRFNYARTVYILGFFTVLTFAKHWAAAPLQCWIPAEYAGEWIAYVKTYCFIENTYYINSTTAMPSNWQHRRENELIYYQWLPYIFALMCFVAYFPKFAFKMLYAQSDVRITDILRLASKEKKANPNEFKEIGQKVYNKFINLIQTSGTTEKDISIRVTLDWYLTAIYLLMKILFVFSIIAQFGIMQTALQTTDVFWGFTLISDVISGRGWRANGLFPRETFCDLTTRDIGQYRPHTVQCVLEINMYVEKIFIVLYVWFFIFLFLTIFNMLQWAYRMLIPSHKVKFIKKALAVQGIIPNDSQVRTFIQDVLRYDGVLMLKLLASNAGYMEMTEVCEKLYTGWEHPRRPTSL